MRVDSLNVSRWKHKCHNRGVVWNTPWTKWAGEGNDWVQEMTVHPPKKDDVIVAFLKMTRQSTKQFLKKTTSRPINKPREMDPVVVEAPRAGKGSDSKRNAVSVVQSTNTGEDLFSKSGLGVGRKDGLN